MHLIRIQEPPPLSWETNFFIASLKFLLNISDVRESNETSCITASVWSTLWKSAFVKKCTTNDRKFWV